MKHLKFALRTLSLVMALLLALTPAVACTDDTPKVHHVPEGNTSFQKTAADEVDCVFLPKSNQTEQNRGKSKHKYTRLKLFI